MTIDISLETINKLGKSNLDEQKIMYHWKHCSHISDFNICFFTVYFLLPPFTEHKIPEIRARAINNVQSKFQSCHAPHLYELTVNVNSLIKHLIKWFDFQPVSHEKQVFEILLLLLKVNISKTNSCF